MRPESLEELWDVGRLSRPGNKKANTKALLDKGSGEATFRQVLEDEATWLTKVGNDFMIRHTEVDRNPVADSWRVDFLFQRMHSLVQLLLKASRCGA